MLRIIANAWVLAQKPTVVERCQVVFCPLYMQAMEHICSHLSLLLIPVISTPPLSLSSLRISKMKIKNKINHCIMNWFWNPFLHQFPEIELRSPGMQSNSFHPLSYFSACPILFQMDISSYCLHFRNTRITDDLPCPAYKIYFKIKFQAGDVT